jgi:hypothetical protein
MRAKSLLVSGTVLVAMGLLAGCGSAVTGSPTAAGAATGGQSQGGAGSQLGAQVRTVADLSNLVGDSVQQATTAQIKMVSAGTTTTGSIKFGNPVAEQMTINAGSVAEQVILVNNNFYVQIPGMSAMTGGKPWMEIQTGGGSNPATQMFTALIGSIQQNADPANVLKNLEASGTLTGSDTEQLNGVATTHYSITVDITKMIANQTDQTMKQLLTTAQQKGLTNYPVGVWVNSSGLPVQTTINLPSIGAGATATGGGLSTITYSNWGAPVTITAPPADQVGTLPTGG